MTLKGPGSQSDTDPIKYRYKNQPKRTERTTYFVK